MEHVREDCPSKLSSLGQMLCVSSPGVQNLDTSLPEHTERLHLESRSYSKCTDKDIPHKIFLWVPPSL